MLINAGIGTIYYDQGYNDPLADQMLEEAGVELLRLSI